MSESEVMREPGQVQGADALQDLSGCSTTLSSGEPRALRSAASLWPRVRVDARDVAGIVAARATIVLPSGVEVARSGEEPQRAQAASLTGDPQRAPVARSAEEPQRVQAASLTGEPERVQRALRGSSTATRTHYRQVSP